MTRISILSQKSTNKSYAISDDAEVQDRLTSPYASTQNCIQITNLTKKFCKKTVVNNFEMSMSKSEIVCLLGNNGAGKTTLINMLVGLIRPDSGDADIYGNSVT